jgi:hypothetical protein
VVTVAESPEKTTQQDSSQEQPKRSGNGSDARKTALRAAAIAAASGATAFAAKKAFSGAQNPSPSKQKNGDSPNDGDSLFGGVLGSGLGAAKDSLLPFAEDAANAAGAYLASNGPDFVRETIVPSFIAGFQEAQKSADDE